jgi:hypothetical protein
MGFATVKNLGANDVNNRTANGSSCPHENDDDIYRIFGSPTMVAFPWHWSTSAPKSEATIIQNGETKLLWYTLLLFQQIV